MKTVRRHRHPARLLGLAGLCLFAVTAARAQNGLTNPDFDDGVGGWEAVDGALAWNAAVDVDACPGSGSATFSSPELVAGKWTITAVSSGSCVAVTPGEVISVWARVLFAAPAATTDFALLGYTDANCSAGEAELGIAGYGPLPLLWLNFMFGSTIDLATHSVRFLMRSADPTVSTFQFSLDRTYLGPFDPIYLDGFDSGSTCHWSSGVV
jgi:hypothetical protein